MARRLFSAIVVACLAALLAPANAVAQDDQAIEAYGGFNYLFADVGGAGFQGGFAFFINDWLGLGAEIGYNSGDLDLPVISIFPVPEIDFDQWTVMFGPRFRITENDRFRLGAQTMFGIAQAGLDVSVDALAITTPGGPTFRGLRLLDLSTSETAFAVQLGLHFDARFSDRIFWRVIQPDLLITGYGGDGQAHFRVGSSIGFEF